MLKKLLGPFKEFGLFAGFLYSVDRTLRSLSPDLHLFFYELMVQPIPESPIVAMRALRSLEIREIKAGAPEIELMPIPPDAIDSRYEQGAVCLGAFQKGKFVGYMWMCFRSYDEDEVRLKYILEPTENSVFDFDFYLFPEHRLGLAFIGLWEGANSFLREQGVKRSFSRLTRYNLASRKAHAHFGWKLVGRAFVLKLWRSELTLATVPPFFGMTHAKSARIHLKLKDAGDSDRACTASATQGRV